MLIEVIAWITVMLALTAGANGLQALTGNRKRRQALAKSLARLDY